MKTFYWKIRKNLFYNYDVIDIAEQPFESLEEGDFDVQITKNPIYRGEGLESLIVFLKKYGWEYPLTPTQEKSNYIHAHWAKPTEKWIEMLRKEIMNGTKYVDVPLLYQNHVKLLQLKFTVSTDLESYTTKPQQHEQTN